MAYPISRGEIISLVAFVTRSDYGDFEGRWNRDAPVDEVRAAFAGWEPEVETYLQVRVPLFGWQRLILKTNTVH